MLKLNISKYIMHVCFTVDVTDDGEYNQMPSTDPLEMFLQLYSHINHSASSQYAWWVCVQCHISFYHMLININTKMLNNTILKWHADNIDIVLVSVAPFWHVRGRI